MILSVSQRTDIPAFYSEWFVNRLKAGYVYVRNPYQPELISNIKLDPDIVDAIAFLTKDATNLYPYLDDIDKLGYQYFFHYTITPYFNDIEKNIRNKKDIMINFIRISKRIGKEKMIWRYDPILINEVYTLEYHKDTFERMCKSLSPYTNTCIISFIDLYQKVKRHTNFKELTTKQMEWIAENFSIIANKYHIQLSTCAEKIGLTKYGITSGACFDKKQIETIINYPLKEVKEVRAREFCHCMPTVDIGQYDSCYHNCSYCYAMNEFHVLEKHDPHSPLLLGHVTSKDRIVERKVSSLKLHQIQFDL